jgi:ABC-type phosphate/phosphonate transport system substrate-binding protein
MRSVGLAMYDPGGNTVAELWADLRVALVDAGLRDVPDALAPAADYRAVWLDDQLLLAQTCGYPLTHELAGKVRYVGTPSYDVAGVEGAWYRSALVVRRDDAAREPVDLRGRIAAYNGTHSQSGYNSFRAAVAEYAIEGRFFSGVVETGSHAASLRAVIDGRADIAAIDAISLALQPASVRDAVRIIGWTEPAPGLPFITSAATSDADLLILRTTLARFLTEGVQPRHAAFRFVGFEVLPEESYQTITAMEQRAIARAYPVLA